MPDESSLLPSNIQKKALPKIACLTDNKVLSTSRNIASVPLKSLREEPLLAHASCTVFLLGPLVIFALVSSMIPIEANREAILKRNVFRLVTPGARSVDWPTDQYLSQRDLLQLSETLAHVFSGQFISN